MAIPFWVLGHVHLHFELNYMPQWKLMEASNVDAPDGCYRLLAGLETIANKTLDTEAPVRYTHRSFIR